MVLIKVSQYLQKQGYDICLISLQDGPLKEEFEKINVPVIIFNFYDYNKPQFLPFLKEFEFAIANTCVCYNFVRLFEEEIPLIWWIHETSFLSDFYRKNRNFRKVIKKSKNIAVVSNYTQKYLEKYNKNTQKLGYFLEEFEKYPKEKSDTINFYIVGSIDERKAQDIVVNAILALPQKYLEKTTFHFLGRGAAFFEKLKNRTKHLPQSIWHGLIKSREEYQKALSQADVLICVSRDDPAPVVVTEACILKIPSIVTPNVGQSEFIEHFKNGFIIDNENYIQLKDLLIKIIDNSHLLDKIGENARNIYQNNYREEIFDRKIKELIKRGE